MMIIISRTMKAQSEASISLFVDFRHRVRTYSIERGSYQKKGVFMKTTIGLLAALLLISAVAILYKTTAGADSKVSSAAASHRPELEYLKAVNSVGPPEDPQLLFLLMAEYSNANRQGEGAEFF